MKANVSKAKKTNHKNLPKIFFGYRLFFIHLSQ